MYNKIKNFNNAFDIEKLYFGHAQHLSGSTTRILIPTAGTFVKITGSFAAESAQHLVKFEQSDNSALVYTGTSRRIFSVSAAISLQTNKKDTFILNIYVNQTDVGSGESAIRFGPTEISNATVHLVQPLVENDAVELYVKSQTQNNVILDIVTFNILIAG